MSTNGPGSTNAVPALFARLIDDAAVFPPGNAPLPDAVAGHRVHRRAWYQELVGPLLLPTGNLSRLAALVRPPERLAVGLIGDLPSLVAVRASGAPGPGGPAAGSGAVGAAGITGAAGAWGAPGVAVRQIEVPVARRGEDPMPGLRELLTFAASLADADPDLATFAEIPLSLGLLDALDEVARARAGGARVAPKFRTGGLAAELFPEPAELAAVICACRDRDLPFKLTAGLHHAVRGVYPETGFTQHGFLNVLAAAFAAADGATVSEVTEVLSGADPVPLVDAVRPRRWQRRPLWIGFGSCSVPDPLSDLQRLGLLGSGDVAS